MEQDDLLTRIYKRSVQFLSIGATASVLIGGLLFLADNPAFRNRVADWAGTELIKQEIRTLSDNIDNLTTITREMNKIQNAVADRVGDLEAIRIIDSSPIIRFLEEGSDITDGAPGDVVRFTIRFIKLRDCGRPEIVGWFRNGDGVTHSFEDISIVDEHGRGFSNLGNPNEILTRSFTTTIPEDDNVQVGQAYGWIEVGPYSLCTNVPIVSSPRTPFLILPERGTPIPRGTYR